MIVVGIKEWNNPLEMPSYTKEIDGVGLKYVCINEGKHNVRIEAEIFEGYIEDRRG